MFSRLPGPRQPLARRMLPDPSQMSSPGVAAQSNRAALLLLILTLLVAGLEVWAIRASIGILLR